MIQCWENEVLSEDAKGVPGGSHHSLLQWELHRFEQLDDADLVFS